MAPTTLITGAGIQIAQRLDPVARATLAGSDRGGLLIVPGARATAARPLARLLPQRLAHAVSDRVVARSRA